MSQAGVLARPFSRVPFRTLSGRSSGQCLAGPVARINAQSPWRAAFAHIHARCPREATASANCGLVGTPGGIP